MLNERYDRQIKLNGFGAAGQQSLQQARVLVVGAGGLGVPVLTYLTAMGLGTIGIVEHDTVSLSNLHRQVLYRTDQVGESKIACAAKQLAALNPSINIQQHDHFLTVDNALQVIASYDVVVDATDNFGTRYLINDACVLLGKPFVYGAIYQYEGQVSVFNYREGATYRCLFPEAPQAGEVPDCSEAGVLGILPGIIGCYQANEVVKIVSGIGEVLCNQLMLLNVLNNEQRIIKLKPVPANQKIEVLQHDYQQEGVCNTVGPKVKKLDAEELMLKLENNEVLQLIDVREDHEWAICRIEGAIHIPMASIPARVDELDKSIPTVFICHHGIRSDRVANLLVNRYGFQHVLNLDGGIHAWANKVDNTMPTY